MAVSYPQNKRSRLPAMFRALRHRNYRTWFIGQTISLVGTWMQTMAQQVLVYRLTGSAAALGMVNFVALIPLIPLSLWGGSLVDRLPKRRVIIVTQAIMLVQALLLAALTRSGVVQVWQVFALSFVLDGTIYMHNYVLSNGQMPLFASPTLLE